MDVRRAAKLVGMREGLGQLLVETLPGFRDRKIQLESSATLMMIYIYWFFNGISDYKEGETLWLCGKLSLEDWYYEACNKVEEHFLTADHEATSNPGHNIVLINGRFATWSGSEKVYHAEDMTEQPSAAFQSPPLTVMTFFMENCYLSMQTKLVQSTLPT